MTIFKYLNLSGCEEMKSPSLKNSNKKETQQWRVNVNCDNESMKDILTIYP